jgi:ferredoxin-NADP reductase
VDLDRVVASLEATRVLAEVARCGRPWEGYRALKVIEVNQECPGVVSFVLAPEEDEVLPHFMPGQFLNVLVNVPDATEPVVRQYSLSDAWNPGTYRITVRGQGEASNHLLQSLEVGSRVPVSPPAGGFKMALNDPSPVVLVGAGVGLTPVVAMFKTLIAQGSPRPVHFFIGVRNSGEFPFKAELERLVEDHKELKLHLHYHYSKPGPDDAGVEFTEGRLNPEAIAETLRKAGALPTDEHYAFYMCGPDELVKNVSDSLRQQEGVDRRYIQFESFGGSSAEADEAGEHAEGTVDQATIHLGGAVVQWTGQRSINQALTEAGHGLAEGCGQGVCTMCKVHVEEGAVVHPPHVHLGPGEEDWAFPCVATPASDDVVLTRGG